MDKINVICYKLKTPIIYNKGTKYEKQCDIFLACYGYEDDQKTYEYIAKLNTEGSAEAKEFFRNHPDIKEKEVAFFFADKQEPFDTRD